MANFYYVSDGATVGTATGDAGRVATTKSTGSFAAKGASACYVSVDAAHAATTPPASGDYILCASDHSHDYAATKTITMIDGVTIMSVDVSNCDQYLAGAKEECANAGADLTLTGPGDGVITHQGVEWSAADDITFGGNGARHVFISCIIAANQTSSQLFLTTDGMEVIFDDTQFYFVGAAVYIGMGKGTRVTMQNNCRGAAGTTALNSLFNPSGSGGTNIRAINSDLASILTSTGAIMSQALATDQRVQCEVHRCKLPTSWATWSAAPTADLNYFIDIAESDSGDGYHYFKNEDGFKGECEQDTTTYLNATYDGSTGFSAQIITYSGATPSYPYRYKLGTIPAQDLTTAKSITVECTSDASLTDNDIWLEIERQDATSDALGVVTSYQNANPLAAGSGLNTTGTGTWTSGDTQDYKITEDIGAITGATNSNVTVYACVGKPGITANFDLPTIAAT